MLRVVGAVCFGLVLVLGIVPLSFAHQAGGVEVGDLETGSVVGQPFKELTVDQELFAMELGNSKVWYPPSIVIDFRDRPGRPVVFKITNLASQEHGFMMTADESYGAPSALRAQIVLKPGETKYIGIPTSDLFYGTRGVTLVYKCHLHPAHIGGKFFMLK